MKFKEDNLNFSDVTTQQQQQNIPQKLNCSIRRYLMEIGRTKECALNLCICGEWNLNAF
jgi:hypothetical protein